MSTILKALRRLEEEKSAGATRPLREEVATPRFAARTPSRQGLPVIGLSVAFALVLGLGAWWLLPRQAGDEARIADVSAESGSATRGEPAGIARSAAAELGDEPAGTTGSAAVAGPPAEAFSSPVEVVPRPAVTPRVPIDLSPREARAEVAASPARETNAPAAKSQPEPAVVAAAPTRTSRPVPSRAVEPKPAPRRSAEVAAPPEPAPATVERIPAPTAPSVEIAAKPKPDPPPTPVAVKPTVVEPAPPPVAAAPRIRVDKTLWHPQRDRREAFVGFDGATARRVHEGEVVGPFVVSEIQPSGVVFESEGATLRRGIGDE